MAEMGPVRKIDDLGRVVIPKEFRKTFNWPIGMEVEISAADGNTSPSRVCSNGTRRPKGGRLMTYQLSDNLSFRERVGGAVRTGGRQGR